MAIHQLWHQPILRNTDLHLQEIINFQEACGGSAHQTWSCTAQTRPDKRENLMWGHDNDPLWPGGAGCYYHPEDKEGVYFSLQAENAPQEKKLKNLHMHWINHMCLLCSESSACTKPACLCRAAQMGVWGDGCCQLTDQAVGRWSHCYSPHKHVGHVRHVPRRHTRGGYCALVFMLSCSVCHRLRTWTEAFC